MKNNKEDSKKRLLPLILGVTLGLGGIASGTALTVMSTVTPLPEPQPEPVVEDIRTITFKSNDGVITSGSWTVKVKSGTKFGDAIKPTVEKIGMIFEAWYKDSQCKEKMLDTAIIESNIEVYAGFVADPTAYVEFRAGETGAEISGNPIVGVAEPTTTTFGEINKPQAILSGKKFVGWTTEEGAQSKIVENDDLIGADGLILYPFFQDAPADYITLSFNAGEGGSLEGITSFSIPKGTTFQTTSKPIATKIGMDFDYWAHDVQGDNPVEDTEELNETTTVYAIYKDVNIQDKIYIEIGNDNYWLTNPTATLENLKFENASGESVSYERNTFNKQIHIGNQVEAIDINFLYLCTAFTNEGQKLVMPASLKSVGDCFMELCTIFNQEIDFSACTNLSYIGSSFLELDGGFNNTITWPTTTEVEELVIGSLFLESCTSFNKEILLPDNVKVIPQGFLSGCEAFNNGASDSATAKPFNFNNVERINSYFLSGCISFNQEVKLDESKVQTIGEDFMYGCAAFNKTLTLPSSPKFTSIGDAFLASCSSFNQALAIPTTVTSIGSYFLYDSAFNNGASSGETAAFTIPTSVKSLGSSFLSYCSYFNQNLELHNQITSIGSDFMYYCANMVSTITIDCPVSVFITMVGEEDRSDYVLSCGSKVAKCYTSGIKIDGVNGDAFRGKFANITGNTPPYRNLVDAS